MQQTYVAIPTDLLVRLINRYQDGFERVIEHAVEDFLERTAEDFEEAPLQNDDGYTWEQVFLPSGTKLRTRYYGEWRVAKLVDGKFMYEGQAFDSPARACNAMRGGTSNNAWMTLEIKRPQDVGFRTANRLRGR